MTLVTKSRHYNETCSREQVTNSQETFYNNMPPVAYAISDIIKFLNVDGSTPLGIMKVYSPEYINRAKALKTLEQLAKKYGYSCHGDIARYIAIYKNRDLIFQVIGGRVHHVSFRKALKILRELKQKEFKLILKYLNTFKFPS